MAFGTAGGGLDGAVGVAVHSNTDAKRVDRKHVETIGPLDGDHTVASHHLIQTDLVEIYLALEAVQVGVV